MRKCDLSTELFVATLVVSSCSLSASTCAATLSSGQRLVPGQYIRSDNMLHTLIMQGDGNVVLYDRNCKPLWATNTNGVKARDFRMESNGSLVLYSTDGRARWNSGTGTNHGAFLNIQDDGNLVIYRNGSQSATADNALWAAGSNDPHNLKSPYQFHYAVCGPDLPFGPG
jgi:hypothetical protein